ncbi:MAG TPA: hypothetical protein VGF84_17350 [Micromonosporaceae bacterium]
MSGYLGAAGVSSCGCLGAIHASPWYAFAADVAALVLLVVGRPRREAVAVGGMRPVARAGLKWVGGVGVLLIGLTAVGTAVYGSPDAALARLRGESLLLDSYLDFGSGKPGDTREATATIRNVSDRSIRLFGGTSDCSCTVLRDLPVTIEPGGSAAIGIQLHIRTTDSGRLTRRVFLRTDDPGQQTVRFAIGCRVE